MRETHPEAREHMEILAKRYEKIAILRLTASVSSLDVVQLDAELPALCKTALTVLIDITAAQLDAAVVAELVQFREKHKKAKPRFLLIGSPDKGCDAADLVSALDAVGSTEADRIIQIFSKEHELVKLKEQLAQLKERSLQALQRIMGPDEGGTISLEDYEKSAAKFRDKNKKLKHTFKVWDAESAMLRKQRGKVTQTANADPEAKKAVAEAIKKLMGFLKSERLLEG